MLQVVLAFLEDPKCRMNQLMHSNDGFWLCWTNGNLLDYTHLPTLLNMQEGKIRGNTWWWNENTYLLPSQAKQTWFGEYYLISNLNSFGWWETKPEFTKELLPSPSPFFPGLHFNPSFQFFCPASSEKCSGLVGTWVIYGSYVAVPLCCLFLLTFSPCSWVGSLHCPSGKTVWTWVLHELKFLQEISICSSREVTVGCTGYICSSPWAAERISALGALITASLSFFSNLDVCISFSLFPPHSSVSPAHFSFPILLNGFLTYKMFRKIDFRNACGVMSFSMWVRAGYDTKNVYFSVKEKMKRLTGSYLRYFPTFFSLPL